MLINLLFKDDNHPNAKRNANIACQSTFVFWCILLLINSVYELFDRVFISNSITILLAGLAVFFAVDLLLRTFKRT